MKNVMLWLFLIVLLAGGYALNLPQPTYKSQSNYGSQVIFKRNKMSASDKKIVLQRTVAAYARSIKASGMQCNLSPEEVAYCFSRKMFGGIYEGTSIKMRNGDEWNFFVSGFCGRRGDCKIVITSQGKNYVVDLYIDRSGYIMADNPSLKK